MVTTTEKDWAALGGMSAESAAKERLVLRLAPKVREAIKAKARELGLSPSAYVTALFMREEGR